MSETQQRRFERNALILLVSSVGTSALGFAYWAVAERLFSTADVGRASTIVMTVTMLGAIGGMALGSMYERFLTSTGPHQRRAVVIGAAAVTGACLLLGSAFALLHPVPSVLRTTAEHVLLPLVVVAFGLFALADAILVGLRRPRLVAWKNLSVSVLKLLALVAVAGASAGAAGIYGSWAVLAGIAGMIAIGWAIFRGDGPARARATSLPPSSVLWAHHRAVFSLMLVGSVAPTVLPLMVVQRLGLESAAHYNVAAVIVTAVAMLDMAIASSYISEAGHPQTDTAATTRRLLVVKAVTACVTVVALAGIGPIMLRIVGADYAEAATGFLRLMAVAAVAQLFIGTYALLCRIESRLTLLTRIQIVAIAALIGGCWWAMEQWELTGVGLVFVTVDLAMAAIVAVPFWRSLGRLLNTDATRTPPPAQDGITVTTGAERS